MIYLIDIKVKDDHESEILYDFLSFLMNTGCHRMKVVIGSGVSGVTVEMEGIYDDA